MDYYVLVPTILQSVRESIARHSLLHAGDRLGVAVSGGADSVALLRLLLELRKELGIVLSTVHFNHRLRGADADADQGFVAQLAQHHRLPLHVQSADTTAHADQTGSSLEAAARELRYTFFRNLLSQGILNRVATAHTLDDQAETVLLKLVRGAGSRGLAGIHPRLSVAAGPSPDGAIVRPLLTVGRSELEVYLRAVGQPWREDKSNRDLRHARNRVRHGILPRLERHLNPAVRQTLAETAEIARGEEEYWWNEVASVLERVWKSQRLAPKPFSRLPLAVQRRVARAVAESLGIRLEFCHVEELLNLIANNAGAVLLPHGWSASWTKEEIQFVRKETRVSEIDYEYVLSVPGSVDIPETGQRMAAVLVKSTDSGQYNRERLLDRELLPPQLRVRNWRAGDRFWPAHTKAPRKIKELLQEQHVTGPERKLWPVLLSGNDVVWLRGFAAPARMQPRNGSPGVAIEESPLPADGGTATT